MIDTVSIFQQLMPSQFFSLHFPKAFTGSIRKATDSFRLLSPNTLKRDENTPGIINNTYQKLFLQTSRSIFHSKSQVIFVDQWWKKKKLPVPMKAWVFCLQTREGHSLNTV